jgi:TetR/AcrR family transcriptional regulator, mexJK operon transcriptional repressor
MILSRGQSAHVTLRRKMKTEKPADVLEAGPRDRSADKRSSILNAAAEIFLNGGFLGTSMDEIAAKARVAKQTVYAHFSNKRDLFVAMVSALTNQASDRVHVGVPEFHEGDDLKRYLTDYAVRQLQVVLTPRIIRLRRLVISEVLRFPELGEALYSGGPGRSIMSLAAIFERLAERGVLAIRNPSLAASQFNWLVMSAPLNRAMLLGDDAIPSASELQKHAAESVQLFLAAYRQ